MPIMATAARKCDLDREYLRRSASGRSDFCLFLEKCPCERKWPTLAIMRPLQSDSRAVRLWGMAIFVIIPIAGVVSFLWLIGLWG
jgi:hypothetical protein